MPAHKTWTKSKSKGLFPFSDCSCRKDSVYASLRQCEHPRSLLQGGSKGPRKALSRCDGGPISSEKQGMGFGRDYSRPAGGESGAIYRVTEDRPLSSNRCPTKSHPSVQAANNDGVFIQGIVELDQTTISAEPLTPLVVFLKGM